MAKRVSTDEKLAKIINFFKTTQDIYCIKDLEKKLQKECAVSSMLVPDLIKKLLDDNLISVEKCGISNVFWCFKFQQHHFLQCETEKALLAIENFKEEIDKKRTHLEQFQEIEKSSLEREDLLKEFNELKGKMNKIEEDKKQSGECSAGEYKKLFKEKEEMVKKVNKITDDIFTIQGHMASSFNINRKDFNKSFGLEDDMDYL